MVLFIDPFHTNHSSIRSNPSTFGRLCKGSASGAKIIHIKILSFSAIITLDPAHGITSFCLIITYLQTAHKQLLVSISLSLKETGCLHGFLGLPCSRYKQIAI